MRFGKVKQTIFAIAKIANLRGCLKSQRLSQLTPDPPRIPLKKGDFEPDSGSPGRGLGGSGVLIPTQGLFKHPLSNYQDSQDVIKLRERLILFISFGLMTVDS